MSGVTPAASISSQSPIVPIRPLSTPTNDAISKRNAEQSSKLAATAVAAQASKESGKGLVLDIKA